MPRRPLGRVDEAASDLEKAIELDSKDPAPHKNLGLIALRQKNYGIALQELSRAIELNPKYARAYHNRYLAYKNKRDMAKAKADLDEAVRLDPSLLKEESKAASK